MEGSYILNKLSELNIGLDIRGDINLDNVEFNASMISGIKKENESLKKLDMSSRYRYRRQIDDRTRTSVYKTYFTPTIPITYDNLVNSKIYGIGPYRRPSGYVPTKSDFVGVFSDIGSMIRLTKYIIGTRRLKPITIDQAKELGFIEKNIDLILSIYFDSKNVLTFKGRKYYINSFDWSGNFELIRPPPSKTTNKITGKTTTVTRKPYYKINITLYVLNEDSNKNPEQRKQLSCKIKKIKINEDLYKLGFFKRKPSNVITKRLKYTSITNPLVEKSKLKSSQTRKMDYRNYGRYDYDNKKQTQMKNRLKEIEEQQRLMREREKLRRRLNERNNDSTYTRKKRNENTSSSDLFR